ncbi:hypothetical protein AB4Y40_36815 [Paraburkholderia sp. EG287B]|uniref:hypothetical protein n=1 Tax=unclassified Paraburkholderia TaxID=2615204 RepID=UPI0034D1CB6D
MVMHGMSGMRDFDGRLMVMRMMGVMLDLSIHAAQHLGHRRREHAQQDGKHPEPGTKLLTVAVEHRESARRQNKLEGKEC